MTYNYKHLRPAEIEIFERFLKLNPFENARFEFDVHLGDGVTINPNWDPAIQTMAKSLTQRRVDVIAHTQTQTWILEIKVRSGPSAIGQLLLYHQLYMEQYQPEQTPLLGIIARRDSHDMMTSYFSQDITLFLV